MSIIETISLFGIMVALAAMPSASVALVITRSVTLGVANGIAVSVGIVLGDLVFILLAILGLSVVAETMGSLFMVIKYLGATYLLWLGYTLLTSKSNTTITLNKTIEKRNLAASFFAGFILTLGDIKAIVFYVSLFPVFIDLTALNVADILIIISVMVVCVGSVKILYAFSATKIASLARSHKLDNAARKTAGCFMVGAGSYLIVKA
ncbi:LysE family translocator [Sulfuriflexus mobilis]|uniref:LysE family translocator n=1 Tax=Sulfuriflexus mobilis TaxID=1811807 RepID=UPI000F83219F|nr:LysE family translocator [Sulfuriflexus mobilis]